MPTTTDTYNEEKSAEEIFSEISEILARGYLRLHAANCSLAKKGLQSPENRPSTTSADENYLDFPGPRSVHRHDG